MFKIMVVKLSYLQCSPGGNLRGFRKTIKAKYSIFQNIVAVTSSGAVKLWVNQVKASLY